MESLKDLEIVRLTGAEKPLSVGKIQEYRQQIPGWQVIRVEKEDRLQKAFTFEDFARALDFTARVGSLAEQADHHPSLLTEWGKVTVTWWTHKIKGIHLNDLIMAAKTDQQYESMQL